MTMEPYCVEFMLPLNNTHRKLVAIRTTGQWESDGFTQAISHLSCLCLPAPLPPHPYMAPDTGAFGGKAVMAVRKDSGSWALRVWEG